MKGSYTGKLFMRRFREVNAVIEAFIVAPDKIGLKCKISYMRLTTQQRRAKILKNEVKWRRYFGFNL